MSKKIIFKISIPSHSDFFGRECKNSDCKKYFKIHRGLESKEIYCPYCGMLFDKDSLLTQSQTNYAVKKAKEEAMEYVSSEFNKIFKNAFGKSNQSASKGLFNFKLAYKPGRPYRKKYVPPPIEKTVDVEIECSECEAKFQVYGLFGYCPVCKCDNVIIYDTNISKILAEISHSNEKARVLRYAYNDLVATFEDFCKKRNHTRKRYNFQNFESICNFFNDASNYDVLGALQAEESLTLKRLFQKRHVYQHNKGIIDQKYIDIIPEDIALLNQAAPLDLNEFIEATNVIRKILLKII